MAIAAPRIDSVTRPTANRTWLQVDYTAMQSGYNRIYAYVNGVQATTTDTMNGQVLITSVGGSPMPPANSTPRVWLIARHATNELSGRSNEVNAPAWTPATPTLTAAVRSSATRADLTISGLQVGGRAYIKRRTLPSGTWAQVDAFDVTSTSKVHSAPAPGGTTQYEFHVTQGNWSVESAASSSRTVEAWYQTPPAPLLPSGSVTRNSSTGRVTLVIGAPSATSRNRWLGMYLLRAPKGQPLKRIRTLSPAAQTVYDDNTSLTSGYDYGVESYNETGVSSSRPTASVDAVRDVPNAASGLALTHLGGDQYKLDWSTTPTTERPITNQRILARVPGQTATTVLATASGSVTTYTLTLPANRVYELAVLPTNSVGEAASTSNWAGPAVSTPLAPQSVGRAWLDATTVRVAWPARTTVADVIDIEFSTQVAPDRDNPAHWLAGATVTASATSWSHTSVSQVVPHTYRIRARHAGSGRVSAWVYSATLEGQAAPLAPTMHRPAVLDATGLVNLLMTHNSTDGTAQTMGEFRYRAQGSSTWIVQSVGSNRFYNIQPDVFTNGQWLEVQGRTAAASGVFGPWADALLVPLRARPTVTITAPAPAYSILDWEAQTVTVTWESSAQVSATIRIRSLDRDETVTLGPDARSQRFDDLLDAGYYWIELTVRDAWQPSQTVPLNLRVAYNLPAPPALSAKQAPAASVLLQAAPVNALQLRRSSGVARASEWSQVAGTLGTSTLTLPGGSTVETTTITGTGATMTTPAITLLGTFSVTGFTAYCDAGATLTLQRYEGASLVASTSRNIEAGVPTVIRWKQSTGMAASTYRVVVGYPPSSAVHVWGEVAIAAPDPVDLDDDSYFDANTVREGYVYGWLSDGVAYEAEVASGTPTDPVDVAPTVSIEIWCSESGLPGTYRLCGVTGSGWDYHDEHPRIGVPTWYVARAVAESGAWAESTPVRMVIDSDSAWVHFGPDRSLTVHGGWNPTLTAGGGRNKVKKRYAGHDRDVTYYGSRKPRTVSAQISILPGDHGSSREEWLTASETAGTVLYRDPAGQLMEGDLDGVSWSGSHDMFQQISFTVTESA